MNNTQAVIDFESFLKGNPHLEKIISDSIKSGDICSVDMSNINRADNDLINHNQSGVQPASLKISNLNRKKVDIDVNANKPNVSKKM